MPQQQQQQQLIPQPGGGHMPPQTMQTNLYDSVNCDYTDATTYGQQPQGVGPAANQNFGNPYDCPEGMYGGSMMSSAGYSKVIGEKKN